MDTRILSLFSRYGMPVSERSVIDDFLWNGENLGLRRGANYSDEKDMYLSTRYIDGWQIVHELAHWLIAEEWQRSLPEFGMDIVPLVSNGVPRYIHRWLLRQPWEEREKFFDGLLPKEEQETQERLADLLSCQFELEVGFELFLNQGKIGARHYLDKCLDQDIPGYQWEWTEPALQELERRGFSVTLLRQWFGDLPPVASLLSLVEEQ